MAVNDLFAAGTTTLTGDRVVASAAAVVALTGVLAGGLAVVRAAGRTASMVVAFAAGAAGLVAGGFVVATADGGPGTGNGIVGGYAALVLGLAAVLLGGLARARARRHEA